MEFSADENWPSEDSESVQTHHQPKEPSIAAMKHERGVLLNVTNWTPTKTEFGNMLIGPSGDALMTPGTTNSMMSSLYKLSKREYLKYNWHNFIILKFQTYKTC